MVPCYISVLSTLLKPRKSVIPGICYRLIYTLQFVLFTKTSPVGDRTYLNHVSSSNIPALFRLGESTFLKGLT